MHTTPTPTETRSTRAHCPSCRAASRSRRAWRDNPALISGSNAPPRSIKYQWSGAQLTGVTQNNRGQPPNNLK